MPMSLGLGLGLPHVGGNPFAAYTANGYAPEVVLDWSQNKAKGVQFSDLVHTRASNATQIASDGTVQWAPHNLLTYSEDFSNAAWAPLGGTVSANAVVSPDGNSTADRLIEDTNFGAHRVLAAGANVVSLTSGVDYTFSVYLKPNGRDYAYLRVNNSGGDQLSGTIMLTDATVSETISGTLSAELLSNGWVRCSGSFTNNTTAGSTVEVRASDTATYANYTGDGTSGIYIWGAHLYRSDLGGMANNPATGTSYVPTTSAAVYLPRRGHHIYSGGEWKKRCLIEPAATNILLHSTDFTDAVWSKTNVTISADAANGPDGEATADELVEDGTTNLHYASQSPTLTAVAHTFSIFAKANTRSRFLIRENSITGNEVSFNLSDGSVLNSSGATGNIVDFGNGWYRCTFTMTMTAAATNIGVFLLPDSGTDFTDASYAGDGTSGIYIWGAQLETGSVPTSYIPTAGSTATRAADALALPAADITAALGGSMPSAVSIAMKGEVSFGDEGSAAQFAFANWAVDGNNYISLDMDTDGAATGEVNFNQAETGTMDTVASALGSYSPGVNVPFSIASAHSASRINGAVDGTALTENATVTALADLTSADFEIAPTGVLNLERLLIWTEDVGDTGLEEASA